MTRALLVIGLATALGAAPARALPALVGADLGLFLRDEAGGSATPLFALAPRASLPVAGRVRATLAWTFSYDPAGTDLAAAGTQHHRLALRAEYALPIAEWRAVGGVGPALSLMHTTLYDRGVAKATATIARPAASGLLAIEVDLAPVVVRTSVEGTWAFGRQDLFVALGATFDLGGAP